MPNRYNDQDYPRYSDRSDRYDSQSERGSNRRDEGRYRSGRERAQGGSSDYNRDEQTGYYGMSYDRIKRSFTSSASSHEKRSRGTISFT